MTTWHGNKYWFDADRSNYVAYRVISGIALTTGGPVGAGHGDARTVQDFSTFCTDNGWTPCFYSVDRPIRLITDSLGWSSMHIADDTILDLTDVSFTGKRFQNIRSALNNAKKAGIDAGWVTFPDAPLALTDQINVISNEWITDKGMPEMGFTLGGLEELDDTAVRCLIAVDSNRTVHGITSWLPVYRNHIIVGYTLDVMRKRTNGFKHAMEFLIASAAIMTRDDGNEFLSLSGAPLASADIALPKSGITGRLLDVLGRTLEPVYGFRSLLAFKSKFGPQYRPMYLAYPDPAALPSIGNAVARAYLPTLTARQALRLAVALVRRRR